MAGFLMGLSFLLAIACFGIAVAVPTKQRLQRHLMLVAIALVVISGMISGFFVFTD